VNGPGVAALITAALVTGLAALAAGVAARPAPDATFETVIWQPDCLSAGQVRNYRPLGARTLLLQWTAVEDQRFLGRGADLCALDWRAAQRRSGDLRLVVGLQGAYHPRVQDLPALARASRALAAGWPGGTFYAPVELRPDWPAAPVRAYLQALPRPLWVSVYAARGGYTPALVAWVARAVPADVRVLVQDGVGVGHASPEDAAAVVRALRAQRGADGAAVIVEVFRPRAGGGWRAAWPWELAGQLRAYRDLPRVAFDGPHYMTGAWIRSLVWLRRAGLLDDAGRPARGAGGGAGGGGCRPGREMTWT